MSLIYLSPAPHSSLSTSRSADGRNVQGDQSHETEHLGWRRQEPSIKPHFPHPHAHPYTSNSSTVNAPHLWMDGASS